MENIDEQQAKNLPKRRKKKTSGVHQYFNEVDNGKDYQCSLCGSRYSKTGSCTSNIRKHLESSHPEEFKNVESSSKKRRPLNDKIIEPVTKDGFVEKLTKFIVSADLPYSVVENEAFRDLINYISKDQDATTLPGRTTITNRITDNYNSQKLEVIERIKNANSKVSLVLDLWTSSNKLPLLGIVCRFVDDDFVLQTLPLDLVEMSGPHSGENIAHALFPVLSEFGIEDKILSITTDNASNMDTFFTHLQNGLQSKGIHFDIKHQRVRCLAHILNLCAKTILNMAKTSVGLEKLRKSINEIGRTPQRREIYYRQCGERKLLPGLDCDIRWNSTFDMLSQSIGMRSALDRTCLEGIDKLADYAISDDEWNQLNKLMEVLKPLKTATLSISAQHRPTIAKATIIYQDLFQHFDQIISCSDAVRDTFTWLVPSIKAAKEKLLDYYGSSGGKAHSIGFMLHPSYKKVWFKQNKWKAVWIKDYEDQISSEFAMKYEQIASTSSCTTDDDANTDSAEAYERVMGSILKNNELQKYFAEPVVPLKMINKTGVLKWWQSRQHEYSCLANMAKDFLSVTGSSVPVESFFSSGTDILTDNRQRLTAQHVRELMCSKKWFKHL